MRVLVVDDERSIADSLALILQARGYIVRKAYSGEEAAEVAEVFQPHAAISEMFLPGMSGLDLSRWLVANCATCKVLLLVPPGEDVFSLVPQFRGRFPGQILPKPVHPSQILEFVASCAPRGQ